MMAMKWIDMMDYIHIAQLIAFIMLLTHTAMIDLRTRTIPDHIPMLIILIRLIDMEPVSAALGFIFVPLPFFIMALLKENSIGGGDIKLMGACGFYLGPQAGYVASVLGLMLAILIHFAYSVIGSKKANKSIALAPYLGIGCILAYFLVK
jgi:leader peptidase (prepilin peptidase)/N-methyltransferase